MPQNFIFEELNGTKHFFRWNPSKLEFPMKERTQHKALDGPPLIHMLDSTEVVGIMRWENAPRNRPDIYDEIVALVGKTGYIYFNDMPSLVGYKNAMPVSSYDPVLYSGQDYLDYGCLVSRTVISDGSTLAPDGISMVWLWKRSASGGTGNGCIYTENPDYTLYEDNVFSCHAKEDSATQVALNLRKGGGSPVSHYGIFEWVDGILVTSSKTAALTDYGVIDVGDGWYRPWVYLNASSAGYPVGREFQCYIYPHYEAGSDGYQQESTYVWGLQIEAGVKSPGWYAHTTGNPKMEPMLVQFLDMQTEYTQMYASSHHDIALNFNLISEHT